MRRRTTFWAREERCDMANIDRLRLLKDEATSEGEDSSDASQRKWMKGVIDRLKAKETPKVEPSTIRLSQLKTRIQGGREENTVDLKKSIFTAASEGTFIYFIGKFYLFLENPISKIAGYLNNLPMSRNLKKELNSADISMSPETYLVVSTSIALLAAIMMLIVFAGISITLQDIVIAALSPVLALGSFIIVIILSLFYPTMKANERALEIDKELPFALRHLSTQIKAGVSFHQALVSVATSNYGVLSEELRKVLSDLDQGLSTDEALLRLSGRVKSRGLRKAVIQIIRSFKTGGNLSEVMSSIAEDVSFETRMRIRDFTEQLNFINILYIMVAVVAPIISTVFSAIIQLPIFNIALPSFVLYLVFSGILGMSVVILFITKKLEPTA